jgi:GNAT superfamily N-acetyltransferase
VRSVGGLLRHLGAARSYVATVTLESIEFYVAASIARWQAMRRPSQADVRQPGLYGLLACDEDPHLRLLVTSDMAYDALGALCAGARAGMIKVFAEAAHCAELLDSDPTWRSSPATAMICRDLADVPALALPESLRLRAVRRVDGDPSDGVALEDAVAAVLLADPGQDREELTMFLRSLPQPTQLLAAVDADGVVRATSGWQLAGRCAGVIFVDTDPVWRGRGIATAMTSAALLAARRQGAREATLDASAAGRPIYLRLGFEPAGQIARFIAPSG